MKGAALTEIEPLAGTGEEAASLQEQTYLILKRLIADGQIRSGERLLEAQVATAFSISRSPARHALALLHRDKLVEEDGKRGYRVAGASNDEGEDRLAKLEPVKLSVPRQWELMYHEVEQELFVRMLFGAVRINEMRLAQHFGVSRTVTRDLLARMHAVGMISKDDAGHWVAEQVTPERIHHLYEMRVILEPEALLRAAPHIPDDQLREAHDHVAKALASSPLDSTQFDQVENDLHVMILSYCPNEELLTALARTQFLFGPTRYLSHPFLGIPVGLLHAALKEHLEIITLLQKGDQKGAADALRRHLQVAVDRWLQRFEISSKTTDLKLPPYLATVPSTKDNRRIASRR